MLYTAKEFLFLSLIFGFTNLGLASDWELKKNENGISVYTRDIPGSNFKELKAVTNFTSTLSGLAALIMDIPSHPLWIYQCEQARVVKAVSDSDLYYYHDTYTPWPVSNRDGVVYLKIVQDPKTKTVSVMSEGVSGMVDEVEGKVRVSVLKAPWKFTLQPNGTVYGEYQLFVDPGGDVPSWLANMFAIDGPYNSILNMKKILAQDKYQSAKLVFIKN